VPATGVPGSLPSGEVMLSGGVDVPMPSWANTGVQQVEAETTATINNGLMRISLACRVRRRPRLQPLGPSALGLPHCAAGKLLLRTPNQDIRSENVLAFGIARHACTCAACSVIVFGQPSWRTSLKPRTRMPSTAAIVRRCLAFRLLIGDRSIWPDGARRCICGASWVHFRCTADKRAVEDRI
jgi:hypothetical protein